jgi:inosine-uridine nucleoside N-ribohydrolase
MRSKKIIIIDTDPGQDDALAIMLLQKTRMFDIQAITTVAGNSTIQNVTNNARCIIDLLRCDVPIFSGSDRPLIRDLIIADVHGTSGLDGAEVIKVEPLNNLAVEKIISLVKDNPKKVSIVVIGPQTNIAKAILQEPNLPKLVKEFVIMGGAIDCPGNKNRTAEFNIFVDPEAAEIVFNSGAKIILIPLDICNKVILSSNDFEKIKENEISKKIKLMMRKYAKAIYSFEKIKGVLVYDALAAYYLINKKAYKLQKVDIRIETKGEYTRGMSVIDSRIYGEKNFNVDLVVELDKKAFVRDFIRILGS